MRNIKIITDSCADLGTDLRAQYDIGYVQMHIVYNGEEKPATLDWDLYTPRELYDILRAGGRITTTQVPVEDYTNAFTAAVTAGCDVLYVGCSSALSGSINTGMVVAKKIMAEYPEARICCVDALNSCLGQGLLTVTAAQMRDAGKTLDEIVSWLEENKLCCHQFATVESLEYLARAGRVKAAKAFFGNLMGVKPILISDARGQNYAIKKAKGRKGSMAEIVAQLKAVIVNPEEQTVFVGHADCIEDGQALCEMVRREIGCKDVYLNYIGPIIGVCTGPGTLSVYAFGTKVETVGE